MKRSLTLLFALALCLTLTACHRYLPETTDKEPNTAEEQVETAAPAAPENDAEPEEPLQLDVLNVEFVAGERDVDELILLKQSLPRALINALDKRNVKVGELNVTFGTSDEATAEALRSGAVDLAFLSLEADLDNGFQLEAVERRDMPELSLSVIAQAGRLSAPLTEALLDALPALKDALAHYTGAAQGGVFVPCTQEMLDNFVRLSDTGEAVLHTESAQPDGRDLALRGVGKRVNDYACGIRAIEVWDNDAGALLQTIEMTEAANDPDGGLDEYTSCPEAKLLFRTVDANFDGHDDIEVFGWTTNNTIPYFYWLWSAETQRYEYRFRLQGPSIDPISRTLTAEYRESAAAYYKDVYEWRDGELTLLSHEQVTE